MQLVCASCPCVPLNLFSKMTLILKRYPFIMQKDVIHSPSALLSLCPFPDLVPEVHFLSGCHFSSSCFPSLCYGINYFFVPIECQHKTRQDRCDVACKRGLPGYHFVIFASFDSNLLFGYDAFQCRGCGALLHDGPHDAGRPRGQDAARSPARSIGPLAKEPNRHLGLDALFSE